MVHQADEGNEMQASHRLRHPFVIARQPAKPRRPAEMAFHHPASGQQHDAALGLGQIDDHQLDAVRTGGRRRLRPGGAVIDEGHLDRVARFGPNRRRQVGDHRAIVGLDGRDQQGQHMAQRIDRDMGFAARALLGPVPTYRGAGRATAPRSGPSSAGRCPPRAGHGGVAGRADASVPDRGRRTPTHYRTHQRGTACGMRFPSPKPTKSITGSRYRRSDQPIG